MLLAAEPERQRLLAVFVCARVPLTKAEWQHIPAPCPDILRALPAALTCSDDQALEVVTRLSPVEAARLCTALGCLHVSQRRSGVFLPPDIFRRILVDAVAGDAC